MWFGDSTRVIVRPSGTEAKLKCYIEVASSGGNKSDIAFVNQQIKLLRSELLELLKV
jgi:phosphomannomutase